MIISKLIILLLVFSATLQENLVLNLNQDDFQFILQQHLQETTPFKLLPKNFVFHETMKGSLKSFNLTIPERKDVQVKFVEPKGIEFSVKNPVFVFEMPCTSKENTEKILMEHVEFSVSEMKLYFEVRGRLPSLRRATFSEGHGIIDKAKKFKTKPIQINSLKQLPSSIADFNALVFEAFRFKVNELTFKLNLFLKQFEKLSEVFPFKVTGKTAHYMGNFYNGIPYSIDSDYAMKVTSKDSQGLYINAHSIMDYISKKYKQKYDLPYFDVREALKKASEFIEPEVLEKTLKNLDKIADRDVQIKYDKFMYFSIDATKENEFYLSANCLMSIPSDDIFGSELAYIEPQIQFDAKIEQNIIKISWIKAKFTKYKPFSADKLPKERIEQVELALNQIIGDLASNFKKTLNHLDVTRIFDLSQLFGLTNIPMDVEKVETGIRFNISK